MTKAQTNKLSVPGYEMLVKMHRERMSTLQWISKEVDTSKLEFRKLAAHVARQNPDARTLEFANPETGQSVLVSIPDASKFGNRTNITAESLAQASQAGIDLDGMLEQEERYELTGEYAVWFKQLLAQWAEQGVQMPEQGLEHKVVNKLNTGAVSKLRELAAQGIEAAGELLNNALKAASVR